MAAAELTGFQPETMAEMTAGEIVRWVRAKVDAADLIDEWFDFEE